MIVFFFVKSLIGENACRFKPTKGILLGAMRNEDGDWVDYSGNSVSSYMPDQLPESANHQYLTYYSINSYSTLSAASGSSKRNIVCEKPTSFADNEPTITYCKPLNYSD